MLRHRRTIYVIVCLALFTAMMVGVREALKYVIYETPLWIGFPFAGLFMAACLGIGYWMDKRAGRY